MGIEDRFRSCATVFSIGEVENDAGGLDTTETESVTLWRYFEYPQNPRTRELVVSEFGLEPDANIRYLAGEYESSIANEQIIVDDDSGDRFRILAVHEQRRNGGGDPNHLHIVATKQTRSAAEA